MTYHLRYQSGSDLARRFGSLLTTTGYPTREYAETVRDACPNAAHMEVYEVDETPVQQGESVSATWDNVARPQGALTPAASDPSSILETNGG